ncbi:uncharacterized protein LOC114190762 isoform X9 [Vigna unguiculata]|uniref:uncharacterized protein LOC114190762 isoform X9 n=1 Tax=Vigna unguiculata TaxID=3917 RepID=UPI00101643B7|nr:uncharacterized protein LOC114190762 isoform X9 [Vigna unguiculata]XP_027935582.1 uncharacterized protein LOC114190762 isoform X9 [Vigna unguiculata]
MFDLTAARSEELAFKGSFTNGQRGNLMNGTLDRSASFREDPITMGDQKYTRSVATEELKLFKASVQEASVRARYRSKRLDESLDKLNKCWEAVSLKKQLRNDLLPNERLGGSPFSKMGSQTHRNPSELVNQRLEDRPKNNFLNKRIRTSVAETRAEGLSHSNARQPLAIGKDRDNTKDVSKGCDIVEEKIRRLPAGGETWDRKMKRKRSMGIVVARSIDGEGELKKVTHLRLANDSGLQGSDAHGLRSGYSGSSSKLDGSSSPTPNACTAANNEREKVSRGSVDGSNKERVVLKGNKYNVCDNNHTGGIHALSKGKASRPPRTGALMAGNSCSVSRSSELHETEEQPLNVNKPHSVSGTVNRKRPLPVSSSSHMAQWVGQRPQKITRTRRANVMSPVLNCDEVHTSLEGSSPSDVGTRMSSTISGLHTSNGAINSGIQPVKVKHENMSPPTRLSESEESGAGEYNLKVKRLESNEIDESAINRSYVTSSSMLTSKNKKIPYKEEIGDDLRRQGRGGRGSSVLKSGILPMKEKLETSTLMKPIKNMKPASEKNGSKPGRPPLKKSCDRKATIRTGHPLTNNSPDISVEDDDREELLTAAKFASNASYIGCCSSFWKNLEPIFAPVSLETMSYLKHLVKTTDVDLRCLSQMLGVGSDALDRLTHTENPVSQSPLSREKDRSNQTDSKEIPLMDDMVDQHLDFSILCRQMGSEGNKVAPLYQRVLTALIIDDQIDEDIVGDGHMSFLCERDGSSQLPCFFQGVENQSNIKMEYVFNSGKVSCNGNAMHTSCANIPMKEPGVSLQIDQGSLYPETRLSMLSEDGNDGSLGMHINSCSSSFSCHFEQMSMEDKLLLELQSIGLYPEQVPDLADGDCEAINQDIMQLQKGLFQQVNKKRECFMKLIQAVERGREMEQRALEQVAMDKLVELAYKKKLATRGTSAARYGLSKVSRPVALAFMKRTLALCHKFEETGKSCFLDPVLKDALVAAPSHDNNTGSAVAANLSLGQNSQQEVAPSGYFPRKEQDVSGNLDQPSNQDFGRTGPIVNRGKKKELLLDDVGASPSLRSASTPGGAKGKRSERDRGKDSSGKNSVTKGGRSSASHTRGERKTKAKSKPKTAQLSSSGNGPLSKLMENNNSEHQLACGSNEFISSHGNRKSKTGSVPHNVSTGTEERMDITNLHELDSIELGVGNELTGPQDLDSWLLNIDDDLQDNDAIGLEIPMDDLSDLNMIL